MCLLGLQLKIIAQMPILAITKTHQYEKVAANILKVVIQALSSSH